MINSNRIRSLVLIGIALLSFTIWFADGYFQWVNSDTAGDAYALAQGIDFPRALFSNHEYRARVSATILAYIPFHTVGYLYRELSGDPVTALYVSQGVMAGGVFLLLVLISAAYVSTAAPLRSQRFLLSAAMVLLFAMCLPPLPLHNSLSLTLRFGHQSVMCHYIGAMAIVLAAFFPFWRYLFSGVWLGRRDDSMWKCGFYVLITAAVFSSTVMMIWMGIMAAFALLSIVFCAFRNRRDPGRVPVTEKKWIHDPRIFPLLLVLFLVVFAVWVESMTARGGGSLQRTDLIQYIGVFFHFLVSPWGLAIAMTCIALILMIRRWNLRGIGSERLALLARVFPWLLAANMVFLFFIGLPRVRYRFDGYNLGPDTALPATWSMVLWIMATLVECWRTRRLIGAAPVLAVLLLSNALIFLDFSPQFYAYQNRERQKSVFQTIFRADRQLAVDAILPIPVENVAFTPAKLQKYTIPMLREGGVISPQRKVKLVSWEAYASWSGVFLAENGRTGGKSAEAVQP